MSGDRRDAERRIYFDAMDKEDEFMIRRPPLRRWQTDDFRPRRRRDDLQQTAVTLATFLRVELTRDYLLEQDEDRFTAKREKIYSFFKIPREVEKFMAYGFFQCADSFLFVFTFLPVRFVMALWAILVRPFHHCFGQLALLKPAEVCDALKGIIMLVCCLAMNYIDTSMMYHLIKSQSIIKLYIFYNMLEVGDRLFSAFGQDTIDALLWTATEPRGRKREHFGLVPHLLFAAIYVFLHSLLVLFQATTLNVAINSSNKALLTIMMSNNFVELKGSVFKKFDKNNLFQVACSDVRERFHLFVLLFIVVLQTMKEYSWREERFWVLLPDCVMVLVAEVFVDWVKHAFITRFNELLDDVYRDYTASLAFDTAQTRQKHAVSDHSDLVARRMGFIPLPLGVVMIRVLVQALHVDSPAGLVLLVLAYLCVASFRILNSLVILGKACDLMASFPDKPLTPCASPAAILTNSNVTLASLGNLLDARPLTEDESQETPPESDNEDDDDDLVAKSSFFQQRTRSEPSISLSDRELVSTDA
ncbi:protein TAPT1 homolog [Neocloeon triangulifer]|uniref:protein TAPT1 homolog n=1 Tax=Neocloeon triangulifer TaxID=2078957 RepID=UPI00286F3B25|nr:protein TAPT1 homolog [Neocloeon triangulifer]